MTPLLLILCLSLVLRKAFALVLMNSSLKILPSGVSRRTPSLGSPILTTLGTVFLNLRLAKCGLSV